MDSYRYRFASFRVILSVLLFTGIHSVLFAGDLVYDDLIKISDKVQVEFSNFYQDRSKGQTRCTTVITNTSSQSIRLPLVLTFEALPDGVSVIEDGVFTDGTKYIDFTGQIQGGLFLPGTSSASKIISFSNPTYKRLTPSWSVWSAPSLYVIAIADPNEGKAPLNVDFTAQHNGNIILYEWDFDGDGIFDWSDSLSPDATFSYPTSGSFNATIRITEDTGLTATDSVAISVNSPEGIILREESNFTVSASLDFTIQQEDSVLSFIIDPLNFDTSDPNSINDAFEVSLFGQNGQLLAYPHNTNRDSFLNITEGLLPVMGQGVKLEGKKVTVDLKHLNPGTELTVKFRLVNNDCDTLTWVCIKDIQIESGGQVVPIPTANSNYQFSDAGLANINSDDRIDLLDMAIMASKWGKSVLGGKSDGDLDGNGVVNLADLTTLAYYWCQSVPVSEQSLPLQSLALSLETLDTPSNPIDFNRLSDMSPSISAQYGRTSLNDKTRILYAQLDLCNVGTYSIGKPLIMTIDHLSDPSVQVVGADGVTGDGRPYYDLSGKVNSSGFKPSDVINVGYIAFYNPNSIQFSYTLTVLGMLNHSPKFTSSPVLEAPVDKKYTYDSDAIDPDGDTLTYSLSSSPAGMTIDSASGKIQWKPNINDIGNQSVLIRVQDGHGGFDTQVYQLSVRNNVPNRPPVFTSTPSVEAFVKAAYIYDANAFDPDFDPVVFSIIQGPANASIDNNTGILTWTPTANQAGKQQIILQADDGRGGVAQQPYDVFVQSEPGNNPPVIISTPVTTFIPGQVYTYDVDAIDPDNDKLTYRLIQKPDGMTIDPNTGLISWLAIPTLIPVKNEAEAMTVAAPLSSVYFDHNYEGDALPVPGYQYNEKGTPVVTCTSEGLRYYSTPWGDVYWTSNSWPSATNPQTGFTAEIRLKIYADADSKYGACTLLAGNSTDSLQTIMITVGKSAVYYLYTPIAPPQSISTGDNTDGFHTFRVAWNPDTRLFSLWRDGVLLRGDLPPQSGYMFNMMWFGDGSSCGSCGTNDESAVGGTVDVEYVRWTATGYFEPEPIDVSVEVSDGRGGEDSQSFIISVGPNQPPTIVSEPAALVPGEVYKYDVDAIDPDGDVLTYSLQNSPAGMTIDPLTGMINWSDYELPLPELDFACILPYCDGQYIHSSPFIDEDGYTYIAGSFNGTVDFDPGPGIYNLTSVGNDMYIMKMDPSGSLVWARRIGGLGSLAEASQIVVDTQGSVCIAGYFQGTVNFDPGEGVSSLVSQGGMDMFVLKLNSAGEFLWVRSGGGSSDDWADGIAFDALGNVITTGYFRGTVDFIPGPESFVLNAGNGMSGFVWKLSSEGQFVWAVPIKDQIASITTSEGLAVDDQGNAYVVSQVSSNYDFLVDKLDSNGNSLWRHVFGGSGIDQAVAIVVDHQGNVYFSGEYTSSIDMDPGPGTFYLTNPNGRGIFACKLDTDGNFIWANSTDGYLQNTGYGIAVDCFSNVYIVGEFDYSVDFDSGPGQCILTSKGGTDGFLWKLDSEGRHQWARRFGNDHHDIVKDIFISQSGLLSITGTLFGTINVDLTDGIYNLGSPVEEHFLVRYHTLNLPADVTVQVADGRGGEDSQSFIIDINPQSNQPPTIISEPVTTFIPGTEYNYDVDAIDPDNDILTYGLTKGPDGMAMNPNTGYISWLAPVKPHFDWNVEPDRTTRNGLQCIEADSVGNVYIGGYFEGTVDFDPGPDVFNLTSKGGWDAFICKYSPHGNLLWAISFGYSGYVYNGDCVYDLAVDHEGNVYATGAFGGTVDFDPSEDGTYILTGNGPFILKLDTNGHFVWARAAKPLVTGIGGTQGWGVAVDKHENVIVCGMMGPQMDFGASGQSDILTSLSTLRDSFVWKLDNQGAHLWAVNVNSQESSAYRLTIDPSDNICVAGSFLGTADFCPGSCTYSLNGSSTDMNSFCWKLDPDGKLVWAKKLGTAAASWGFNVVSDSLGNLVVNTGFDLQKLSPNGEELWRKPYPVGVGLAIDSFDYIHCGIGLSESVNPTFTFDMDGQTVTLQSRGKNDTIHVKLDSNGEVVWYNQWTGLLQGGNSRWTMDVAVSPLGDFYAGGNTTLLNDLNKTNLFVARYSLAPSHDISVDVADGRGGIDNQSFTITASSSYLSDLKIADIDNHGLTTDSQTLETAGTITARITNSGIENITMPFEVLFFEDRDFDGLYDSAIDSLLANTTVSQPLPAGQSMTVTTAASGTVLFPGSFVYGFVDSGYDILETNENNNIARSSAECTSMPLPNLLPCYVRLIDSQLNTYSVRIANNGALFAPPGVFVSFYAGNPNQGGVYMGTTSTTDRLAPGHFEDVSISLLFVDKDNLWIWADDDGTGKGMVSECNEDDNIYSPDFNITQPVNRSPIFLTSPVTTATVGQFYRYNALASDADGDTLVFDMPAGKPDGMAIDPAKGVITWTPKIAQIGTHDIVLRVSDGHGGINLQCFQIKVYGVNTPPIIIDDRSWIFMGGDASYEYFVLAIATAGIPFHYNVIAMDADGDTLYYGLIEAPTGMTIDPVTGRIDWVPDITQVGNNHAYVIVDDGRGGWAKLILSVGVSDTFQNEPPVITSTPRLVIPVGETYLYQVETTDSQYWSRFYSLPIAPAGMTIDYSSGLVHWTPTAAQLGSHAVRIHVEDGLGGQAFQEFDINVVLHVINNAPSITSQPVFTAALGQVYAYDAVATDADNDPLFWSLDTAPVGMSVDAQRGSVRWIPVTGQTGSHQVVLRVMDNLGAWATQTYSITVNSVNTPPNITSSPSTEAFVDCPYTYTVVAADSEGDTLQFSFDTSPAGMTINSVTGLIQWTPDSSQFGEQSVVIRADDGKGGYALQMYGIEVSTGIPNYPPAITSTPKGFVIAETMYQYQVITTDPESDTITYSLETAPTGMTIDPNNGLIQWTPTVSQLGDNVVNIAAQDTAQNTAFQSYTVRVVGVGNFPVITSTPQSPATAGLTWSYDIIAHDPDNDPLTYALSAYPQGMTIDPYGRIRWTPQSADIGSHNIAIQAIDTYGLITEQSFSLLVVADTKKPTISLVLSQNPVMLGSQYTMTASAADNVGVVSMIVTLAGSPVALNGNGQATLTAGAIGSFEIVMTAADAAGNISTGSTMLYVLDPNPDPNPPQLEITSPQQDDVITNITDIIGSVQDDNLLYYTLSVARADDDVYKEIFRGTSTVSNGLLGSFDPTVLANDTYMLKLTAVDAAGNTSYAMIEVGVQGTLKLGNFTLSFTDLSIPVSGIPVTVTRTYDSLNARSQQDLGFGWRLELKDTDLRTSVAKTGYEEELGIFNAFYYGAKVYVTTPDGKRQGFTFIPSPPRGWGEQFLGMWHPAFTPDPGVTSQLTVLDTKLQYVEDTGEFYFYGTRQYNPADTELGDGMYTLTTDDGISYSIDGLSGDLEVISDTNGNSLSFTEDAVVSSAGPKVQFQRDIYGRITAVIDPAGNRVKYGYNGKGDLVSVTDREGNVTQFVYRDSPAHYLDQIIDPLGRSGIRAEYDDKGRLIGMVDVNGNTVGLAHDPDNFTETVTDTLGNTKIYVYDQRGNVVTEVDALGGVTVRTYDNKNYLLTETDPLGNTTTYTRDSLGNPLTVTDPLGNITRYTYGPLNTLLTSTDPLGNTAVNAYDSKGNLISTKDAAGNITTYTYDSAGNQTSVKDPMGNITQYEYDSAGRMIHLTNALGHSTSYTYDANGNQLTQTTTVTTSLGLQTQTSTNTYDSNGRVIAVTDAAGNVRRTEYNAVGKMSATIDALGRRTEFIYDQRGLLIETILPDNSRTQTEYDAAGRAVAQIDALGHRTVSVYDAAGRVIETILPDGTPDDLTDNPRTRTEYNIAGQTIAQIDQRGNRTEFEYDAAGRQIVVRNALGQETTTTYDAAGRSIAQTDALGHITRFEYDALGRVVRTLFADGTGTSTIYDTLGRAIAQTNQLGVTTNYEYDILGRLTAVVDALGNRTEYGYNEAGNQVTQTDANGNVTRFEYDILGRRVATILPLGQRSSSVYNAAGNVISTTDFNGDTITFDYNARNQLLAKHLPDGSMTSFAYTLLGQRETITDSRGLTTFAYDVNNRLISRVDPDGSFIQYAYDLAGNRTMTTSPSGTIVYTFDALNRQSVVTDTNGGQTHYTYNAVGNLIRTDLPNGTFETRSYDTLNRLVFMENRSAAGIISSFQYTLDAIGNRIAVVENTGRRVDYVYDQLGRLVSESVTDAVNGNRFVNYTFDAVGNRLSRNDLAQGITTYVYDNNDRLLSETLGIQTTTYTYDNNGNTLSRTAGPLDNANYTWNAESRLITADVINTADTKHIDYQYDADGIRVSSTANGDQTRFLIDTSQPYQQVLEEYTPAHVIRASYVHGLDLISQKQGTVRSFYHVDGLGSARTLTNSAGQITDSYLYGAYGQIIKQTGTTPNSYLFAGEQRDSNLGLDYLRARYMNPSVGRFYGMDTFEGIRTYPLTLNKYAYVCGNPTNLVDPSGRIVYIGLLSNLLLESYEKRVNAVKAYLAYNKARTVVSYYDVATVFSTFATCFAVAAIDSHVTGQFSLDYTPTNSRISHLKSISIRAKYSQQDGFERLHFVVKTTDGDIDYMYPDQIKGTVGKTLVSGLLFGVKFNFGFSFVIKTNPPIAEAGLKFEMGNLWTCRTTLISYEIAPNPHLIKETPSFDIAFSPTKGTP